MVQFSVFIWIDDGRRPIKEWESDSRYVNDGLFYQYLNTLRFLKETIPKFDFKIRIICESKNIKKRMFT